MFVLCTMYLAMYHAMYHADLVYCAGFVSLFCDMFGFRSRSDLGSSAATAAKHGAHFLAPQPQGET